MRRLAVGWVWTNDPTAPVATSAHLLPIMGAGSWILWVLLRLASLGFSGILLGLIQKFRPEV